MKLLENVTLAECKVKNKEYCVCGKVKYTSAEAGFVLNHTSYGGSIKGKKPIRKYLCDICGAYHTTSEEKRNTKKAREERERLARNKRNFNNNPKSSQNRHFETRHKKVSKWEMYNLD